MFKCLSLIMAYMISTTLVFAEHTKAQLGSDITQVLNQMDHTQTIAEQKSSSAQCSSQKMTPLVNKIDKRIEVAQYSQLTVDEVISQEINRYRNIRRRQIKMTKKILKRRWRTSLVYKRVKRNNPELSKNEFVKRLKDSIKPEKTLEYERKIASLISGAGSLENYLLVMKEKIQNCDTSFLGGDTLGLILLIVFIGLPVLSILAALFALIFGAFGWALGLFGFAVVVLLGLFIWSNVGNKMVSSRMQEETQLL